MLDLKMDTLQYVNLAKPGETTLFITGKKVRFIDISLLIQMCDKSNRDIILLISFKR